MGSRWKHFRTVCRHKAVVYHECKACGITWQGIVHDLSKVSPTEFSPSAKYFQGTGSPIEKEKAEKGYSEAWLHHKGCNKHHWEWWTDFADDGSIIANKIPVKYIIEMVCDWVGAGMVYGGGKWTQADPLNYYNKVRAGRHFEQSTEQLILYFLKTIRDDGLDIFHDACQEALKTERRLKRIPTVDECSLPEPLNDGKVYFGTVDGMTYNLKCMKCGFEWTDSDGSQYHCPRCE